MGLNTQNEANDLNDNNQNKLANIKINDNQTELKRLIEYFNFRKKFKSDLLNKYSLKEKKDQLYLIDKKWLKKWKEYIGYKKIKQFYKSNNYNNDLNENDFPWIRKIINENQKKNISSYDNKEIYNNKNNIDIFSEFAIVNKNCYFLFNNGNNKSNEELIKDKTYEIRIFFEKLILIIDEKHILLKFYRNQNESKKSHEIIIEFLSNVTDNIKNELYEQIGKLNINEWLNHLKFNLDSTKQQTMKNSRIEYNIINRQLNLKNNNKIENEKEPIRKQDIDKNQILDNDPIYKIENDDNNINYNNDEFTKININKYLAENNERKQNNNANNINTKNNNLNQNILLPNNQNKTDNKIIHNQHNIINNNNRNFNYNNNIHNNFNINICQNFNNNLNNNYNGKSKSKNDNINNYNLNNNNFNNFNNNNFQINSKNNFNLINNEINNDFNCSNNNNNNYCKSFNITNEINKHNSNNQQINYLLNQNNNNISNNQNIGNNMNIPQYLNNKMNNDFGFNFNNNFQNNYNNLNQNNFSLISYPHKIGLQNLGQTCYMNASLQCLTNIDKLTNNLLNLFQINYINNQNQPLTFVYANLLFEFKTTNLPNLNPQNFKFIVEQLNPLFKGNQASDSKDFITFIIETLHQELKPPEIPQNYFIPFNIEQQELEAQNEALIFQKFINEFNMNASIISDIFYGITRQIMKCEGCKKIKYSFQTFNILNFILKKAKEDKKKLLGDYFPNNYVLNLIDAFESENKEEELIGENMIYCNICKALKPGKIKQDIFKSPEVMIIVLNRGKNNQDFKEKFIFEEELNFTNLTFSNINNPNKRYFLCGIITHLGESSSNGHFICYFRKSLKQKFICYNDTSTSETSTFDAMKEIISHNDNENKIPYILFYQSY